MDYFITHHAEIATFVVIVAVAVLDFVILSLTNKKTKSKRV